ncbi:kxDL motif-containing protein 1-like isoform X3 [Pomacea canaliculata]|uniref:kxDL motif-containing protein 1-like isoform X3 n=1 Tax=Pomacea canaliculata TaxID=400727 RepID=UPI000D73F7A1|nr:kxDL motif-containing protein 1-like isoform X3 [Pomacea canaliculata]
MSLVRHVFTKNEIEAQTSVKMMAFHDSRNYQDAVVVASSLVEQINREDVNNMVQVQRDMLSRYEKTNEMLINFNLLSSSRYEVTVKEFQNHTQLLSDMKRDLDSIFKRIRALKQRLSKNYPEAFSACSTIMMVEDEEEEKIPSEATSCTATASSASGPTSKPADSELVCTEPDGDGMPGLQNETQKKTHTSNTSKTGEMCGAVAGKSSSAKKQPVRASPSHDHGKRLSSSQSSQKPLQPRNQRI